MYQNTWTLSQQDYYGQLRYQGHLVTAAPMAFLIKVYDRHGFGYSKSPKNLCLEHDLDCLFHGLSSGQVQVMLRLDHTVNCLICWQQARFEVQGQGRFDEGIPFTLAQFDNGKPAIELLGIANTKLKTLRNGIWRVKDRYLASIPEHPGEILLKHRHGYIAVPG